MWNHWTARTQHPHNPFESFDISRSFYLKMIERFPDAIAVMLMPNHFHLILPKNSIQIKKKLAALIRSASRNLGHKGLWQPIPEPREILDIHHLRRQIRYVALNPCRKGLCADPLEWFWSSYREVLGAVAGRTDTLLILKKVLSDQRSDFIIRFHAYVSGDPSVSVSGTSFPQTAQPKKLAYHGIQDILNSSAAAIRITPQSIIHPGPLRHLFIHSAYRYGWKNPTVLADICKIKRNSVHWILNHTVPKDFTAVDLCLGDPRLRRF